MWQKVAKFKGAEYFRKALFLDDNVLSPWAHAPTSLSTYLTDTIIPDPIQHESIIKLFLLNIF